jgi:hypothetical protein
MRVFVCWYTGQDYTEVPLFTTEAGGGAEGGEMPHLNSSFALPGGRGWVGAGGSGMLERS